MVDQLTYFLVDANSFLNQKSHSDEHTYSKYYFGNRFSFLGGNKVHPVIQKHKDDDTQDHKDSKRAQIVSSSDIVHLLAQTNRLLKYLISLLVSHKLRHLLCTFINLDSAISLLYIRINIHRFICILKIPLRALQLIDALFDCYVLL